MLLTYEQPNFFILYSHERECNKYVILISISITSALYFF